MLMTLPDFSLIHANGVDRLAQNQSDVSRLSPWRGANLD